MGSDSILATGCIDKALGQGLIPVEVTTLVNAFASSAVTTCLMV